MVLGHSRVRVLLVTCDGGRRSVLVKMSASSGATWDLPHASLCFLAYLDPLGNLASKILYGPLPCGEDMLVLRAGFHVMSHRFHNRLICVCYQSHLILKAN